MLIKILLLLFCLIIKIYAPRYDYLLFIIIIVTNFIIYSHSFFLFSASSRAPKSKVHTSAVCIIPPTGAGYDAIQAIRAKHDAAYERWMPHINLVYPFLPHREIDAAVQPLTDALASLAPFRLALRVRPMCISYILGWRERIETVTFFF